MRRIGSHSLAEFPLPVVRIDCERCGRAGSYRLDGLVARFGARRDGDSSESYFQQSVGRTLARQPTPLQRRRVSIPPPQQPLQMLLSILLSCCWISRSSGVGPADCEAPGRGTVSPVDVR
jgi:hypothetical protein